MYILRKAFLLALELLSMEENPNANKYTISVV